MYDISDSDNCHRTLVLSVRIRQDVFDYNDCQYNVQILRVQYNMENFLSVILVFVLLFS